MNHFGAKPRVGGSPPNEKRIIGVEISRALFLVQEIAKELTVSPLDMVKRENIQ